MSANSKSIENGIAKQDTKALERELGRLVVEAGRGTKKVPAVKSFIDV
jgi:hypothetical protein